MILLKLLAVMFAIEDGHCLITPPRKITHCTHAWTESLAHTYIQTDELLGIHNVSTSAHSLLTYR